MNIVLFFQCFAGSFLFYLAHWQTYVTGNSFFPVFLLLLSIPPKCASLKMTLFLGKMRFGNFDVSEAQFSMIALMLITSALGSGIWKTEVRRIICFQFNLTHPFSNTPISFLSHPYYLPFSLYHSLHHLFSFSLSLTQTHES